MTRLDRQRLRAVALAAVAATPPRTSIERALDRWEIQTSNSFRRVGCHGDGDVLCATTQRADGHPDLLAPTGVLEYVVAAQPHIVLELLDQLDAAEQLLSRLADVERRLDEAERQIREAQDAVKGSMS